MSPVAIPTPLASLASDQFGIVTLDQLDGLGIERPLVGQLLVNQQATNLLHGVIRIGDPVTALEDLLARWFLFAPALTMADRLNGPILAVASHHSAAYALHLGVSEEQRHTFSVAPEWNGSVADVRTIATPLSRADIVVVDGLPVTNAHRTIVDLIEDDADVSDVATAISWCVSDAAPGERAQLEARLEPYRSKFGFKEPRSMVDVFLALEDGS